MTDDTGTETDDTVADTDDDTEADPEETIGLTGAKDAALSATEELLDDPVDGVIRIERHEDGWRTLVEVIERSSIPDTQDILGRYEIIVDATGELQGYGLEERYRRGESRDEL